MAKILIIYHSRSGSTKKMAELVADGAKSAGAEVVLKPIDKAVPSDMLDADGVVIGSPTYYGHSASAVRAFIDESVKYHGRFAGKVGAAFSSSANIGGGNETAILDILHSFLIHGMVVQGSETGDHYGPVSVGAPDARVEKQCRSLGERVACLSEKLKP